MPDYYAVFCDTKLVIPRGAYGDKGGGGGTYGDKGGGGRVVIRGGGVTIYPITLFSLPFTHILLFVTPQWLIIPHNAHNGQLYH